MSLLNKFRVAQAREPLPQPSYGRNQGPAQPLHAPAGIPAVGPERAHLSGRFSNGLKEFLWQLDGIGHGQLLDLGPVCQATVSFFIECGFKVHTEDVLRSWSASLRAEEEQLRLSPPDAASLDMSASARVERFFGSNLHYAANTFDAILLWDLLDYLDRDMVPRVVSLLSSLVRDGGAILAVFHTRIPEQFHHYRVLDAHNLELVPASGLVQPQRVFQNREIQDLFGRFRSSKTFVGRDQLREGVFVK